MSYLKFDKNLMINLEQSLPKEMLRTNKSGAYHCTTIVGCNTRKQHGLLVIPIPEMDDLSISDCINMAKACSALTDTSISASLTANLSRQ